MLQKLKFEEVFMCLFTAFFSVFLCDGVPYAGVDTEACLQSVNGILSLSQLKCSSALGKAEFLVLTDPT